MRERLQSISQMVALALACAGCSSFTSQAVHPDGPNEGLVYFLPKKDVLVTLTVAGGNVTSVTLGATASYPDRKAAYMLTHSTNGLAKNVTTFEIKNGLLTSTTGTLSSGVADALKNLASSAAGLTNREAVGPDAKSVCGADGNHTYRVASDRKEATFCGVTITITPLGTSDAQTGTGGAPGPSGGVRSGIFYRQVQGILVVAEGQGLNAASIVYVPAQPTYFLPAGLSFFANNVAEITLEDGVPTKFKRDADGEVVALLKLPADVIAAYFTAVGGIFDAFKTRDNKESLALQESLKLELVKQKYAVCLAAVRSADDELITKLDCEKL